MASKVTVSNRDLLANAMLLGAIVGLIASLGVLDPTAKRQVVTLLILPIPIISALALGIGIGDHRVAALAVIALVLALGTYLRRFGPRGSLVGQLLFIGYFVGFLSTAPSRSGTWAGYRPKSPWVSRLSRPSGLPSSTPIRPKP
jgi:hypothetical protein